MQERWAGSSTLFREDWESFSVDEARGAGPYHLYPLFYLERFVIAEVTLESRGRGVYDVTASIKEVLRSSGKKRGLVLVYSPDPLCRLVTLEYDADLVEDLMSLISGLKARNPYVIASIFPQSIVLPFEESLLLGPFQQVCLLDLNESTGTRRVVAEVVE